MMKRPFLFVLILWVQLWLGGCTTASTISPASPLTPTEPTIPTLTQIPSTPKPTTEPVCTSRKTIPAQTDDFSWWNQTVFYEIFVRSFYDSDSDGTGDFNGITEKLDYLNDGDPTTTTDLGVSGIWLMPINPSPSYHGYDVTDYYAVNSEYGTMEDFQHLLEEAHQRGIRVIIDMVLNHTSTEHPWFQDAVAYPDSPYRDYYLFSDTAGTYTSPWGSEVWHPVQNGYYYGLFWSGMPDLNYRNPAVVEEMQQVVEFWLDRVGVDGFRLDAIKHIVEEGQIQENTPATHAFLESLYTHYTSINPDAFTVGEAWTNTDEVVKYIGDEVNIAFEFDTAAAILASVREGSALPVFQAHELILASYPPHQYGIFLTNHDQPRVITELLGDVDKAKSAASLLLTGPGVPFLYYGEEVGQRGDKPDENLRSPMQWANEPNAGFTSAALPWHLPQKGLNLANVADQTTDPGSLLSHYRQLIQVRNAYPALQTGAMLQLPVTNKSVYAFLRYTEDQTLLIVINLSRNSIEDYSFCLSSGSLTKETAQEIFTGSAVTDPVLNASGGFDYYKPIETLSPYTTYIIELK